MQAMQALTKQQLGKDSLYQRQGHLNTYLNFHKCNMD